MAGLKRNSSSIHFGMRQEYNAGRTMSLAFSQQPNSTEQYVQPDSEKEDGGEG